MLHAVQINSFAPHGVATMADFLPTWLMVKRHRKTGLKYFCKTVRYNPVIYKGSGTVWRRHLKKHGGDVETLWYQLFENREELMEYAMKFSIENNIVESEEWANLIYENGIEGGGNAGLGMTDKQRDCLTDTWNVVTPEGENIEVTNMLAFCRANNLNPSAMSAVARGKRGSHHGYRCKKMTNNRKVDYTAAEFVRETADERSKRLSEQAVKGGSHHEAKSVCYKGKTYSSMIEAVKDSGDSYYLVRKYGEYND
jgi:hypothetical protein